MKKTPLASVKLVPMSSSQSHGWGGAGATRVQELEAIARTVASLHDTLLDHSPMLAVCAETLQKAIALEIASQRHMYIANK